MRLEQSLHARALFTAFYSVPLVNGPHQDGRLSSHAYWLVPHVHVCATEEGTVLLDLRKDKYLALSRAQSDALIGLVAEWPTTGSVCKGFQTSTALADKLVAAGVLTRNAAQGKTARPVTLREVEMGLPIGQRQERAPIRPGHVMRFAVTLMSTALSLRWRGLEAVVSAAARRKEHAAKAGLNVDLETADTLVNVFGRLRTLTYTRRNRCLFDALALVNFLAAYGQFPTWVIGVRSRPFMAHSWVQEGSLVFDAAPDAICELIPIVAV